MSNPVTGSVILALQALSNVDNSLLFNRNVTGLQAPTAGEAGFVNSYEVPSASSIGIGVPVAALGFYIKNLDAAAVVTITSAGVGFNGAFLLEPGAIFMWFSPTTIVSNAIAVQSSVNDSLIEYAFWA